MVAVGRGAATFLNVSVTVPRRTSSPSASAATPLTLTPLTHVPFLLCRSSIDAPARSWRSRVAPSYFAGKSVLLMSRTIFHPPSA